MSRKKQINKAVKVFLFYLSHTNYTQILEIKKEMLLVELQYLEILT